MRIKPNVDFCRAGTKEEKNRVIEAAKSIGLKTSPWIMSDWKWLYVDEHLRLSTKDSCPKNCFAMSRDEFIFRLLEEKEMTIDFSKPVQTKCGKPVRILCTDRKGTDPVIGLIMKDNGKEVPDSFSKEGKGCYELVNVPEKLVRWVNVYRYADGGIEFSSLFESKEEADEEVGTRCARLRIEFEVGQYDEEKENE